MRHLVTFVTSKGIFASIIVCNTNKEAISKFKEEFRRSHPYYILYSILDIKVSIFN